MNWENLIEILIPERRSKMVEVQMLSLPVTKRIQHQIMSFLKN